MAELKTSILIRSYARDRQWLDYCLRSIKRFCKGFHEIVVIIPGYDQGMFFIPERTFGLPIRVVPYAGNRAKPMLACMAEACMADEYCPTADLICNVDSDCIFTKATTPETFMQDGKPILLVRTFDSLKASHNPSACWQVPTERALAMSVTHETMARHPAVHWRELYPSLRAHIEHVHMKPFRAWAVEGPNVFPWPWAEFPALGFWAMKTMPEKYSLIDVSDLNEEQIGAKYKDHIHQGWTHFDMASLQGIELARKQKMLFERMIS